MGLIYINTYCRECKSDSIISGYNEEFEDIWCSCLECGKKGFLKEFDYILDGDTEI